MKTNENTNPHCKNNLAMVLQFAAKIILLIFFMCSVQMAGAQVSADTQLDISTDGKLVAIGYVDKFGNGVVDIADLSQAPNIKAQRVALGKNQVYTFAFGVQPNILLITTIENGRSSNLLSVDISDVKSPQVRKLYSHSLLLRFPKQIDEKKYVFLKQIDGSTGSSKWTILENGRMRETSAPNFRLGATPSVVAGNVFLPVSAYVISKESSIVEIVGEAPEEIKKLYSDPEGFMVCADTPNAILCLRKDFTLLLAESYSNFVLAKGGVSCKVPGQWRDSRSMSIARNGSFAAFQAIPRGGKTRGIYLINIADKACNPQPLNIEKGN